MPPSSRLAARSSRMLPPASIAGAHRVQVGRAVDDRRVDDLALAAEPGLEEGGEDADDEVRRAATEVADQVGREVRSRLVLAHPEQGAGDGDVVHVVAGRLRQRPALPPPGHPAVDQPRVARQALLGTEPEAFRRARAHALDQHVRLGDEVEDGRDRVGLLEVQRHARTPPVEQVVRSAGQHLPARPLDPDHVGTEVGQDHAGVRARPDAGDLDDLDPLEGSGALSECVRHAADCGSSPERPTRSACNAGFIDRKHASCVVLNGQQPRVTAGPSPRPGDDS